MPAAVKPPTKSDLKEALNTLPKATRDEILKDRSLSKRIGELLTSLKGGAETIRGKLNKSEIEKIIKSESRSDIKARVKGTPKGKSKGESRADIIARIRGTTKPKPKGESRADIKARVKGTPTTKLTEIVVRPKPSVKDVAPLGGSSYEIKKGDTLSAIAKRKNTTVAALMRMNPKIKDKDKIRAGQFIKEGKPKTEAQKLQISKNMEQRWLQMPAAERKRFSEKAKQRWDKLTDSEKNMLRKRAAEALRRSSIEGSKAEKFLYTELTKQGYDTIIHKKHLIEGENFEIDLFLPTLGVAIEIDGPQHFTPMFGEKHLRNYIKYDSIKNGLLISKGYCIIRVKYLCKHISHSVKRRLWNMILPEIEKIETNFPPKDQRLIELEIS